jgi:hypothetical protein
MKSLWHSSKIELLQCQPIAQNAKARSFRNSEVSSKKPTGRKRAFFQHGEKCFGQVTFSTPARPWIIGKLSSPIAKARVPLVYRRQGKGTLVIQ